MIPKNVKLWKCNNEDCEHFLYNIDLLKKCPRCGKLDTLENITRSDMKVIPLRGYDIATYVDQAGQDTIHLHCRKIDTGEMVRDAETFEDAI